MKKFLIIVFFLLLAVVSYSVSIVATLSRGSETNFFNSKYRANIVRSQFLRTILNLHEAGDARSDYLGNKYNKILIEVDSMEGLNIPADALDSLVQKISAITGKDTTYLISSKDIPNTANLDDSQITKISDQYRIYHNTQDTATVYLLYASNRSEDDAEVGSSYRESGIVLYDKTLQEFAINHPENFSEYIESTALHEFGHLLGLDHNDEPGCLMNAVADDYDLSGDRNGVITDFCDTEKQQISNLR